MTGQDGDGTSDASGADSTASDEATVGPTRAEKDKKASKPNSGDWTALTPEQEQARAAKFGAKPAELTPEQKQARTAERAAKDEKASKPKTGDWTALTPEQEKARAALKQERAAKSAARHQRAAQSASGGGSTSTSDGSTAAASGDTPASTTQAEQDPKASSPNSGDGYASPPNGAAAASTPAVPPKPALRGFFNPNPVQRGKLEITRGGIQSVVEFQFNPESLRRQLQPKIVGGNSESKAAPLYYTGPPVETISVRLEISAAEPDSDMTWTHVDGSKQLGVRPMIAAIELALYPPLSSIQLAAQQLKSGMMEIGVYEVPLIVFAWGDTRAPVKLTSYSVTEQQFNRDLVPVLATVDLGMQVLSAEDVSVDDPAYEVYVAHQKQKEALAKSCYKVSKVEQTSLPLATFSPSLGELIEGGVNEGLDEVGDLLGEGVSEIGSIASSAVKTFLPFP